MLAMIPYLSGFTPSRSSSRRPFLSASRTNADRDGVGGAWVARIRATRLTPAKLLYESFSNPHASSVVSPEIRHSESPLCCIISTIGS